MQAFSTSVDIVFHSRRRRLTDPDGASCKWALDAIVKAGIIQDDSPKEVKSVTFTQEKIGVSEPETVTVTITEAGHDTP